MHAADRLPVPCVLLHGFMQDAGAWDEVRRGLTAAFALDYVGASAEAGAASASAHPCSLASLVDAVHAGVLGVCRDSGSARVVLAGYSMGGRVAALYALAYPETVAALVLESAGLGCRTASEQDSVRVRNEEWAQRIERAPHMSAVVDWWEGQPLFASQKALPPEVQAQQREMRLACEPRALASCLRDAGPHAMPLESALVAQLEVQDFPVHYIAGERDAKYSALADRLPESFAVTKIDAGHNVHMEQPQAVRRLLEEIRDRAMKGTT